MVSAKVLRQDTTYTFIPRTTVARAEKTVKQGKPRSRSGPRGKGEREEGRYLRRA